MFRLTRSSIARRDRREASAPRKSPVLTCPVCDSDRICPIEWAEAGEHHWWMVMHCGECQAWVQGLVGNELAAAIDVELDRQQAEISHALKALESERMAADVETFAAALQHDLVDADDFAQ